MPLLSFYPQGHHAVVPIDLPVRLFRFHRTIQPKHPGLLLSTGSSVGNTSFTCADSTPSSLVAGGPLPGTSATHRATLSSPTISASWTPVSAPDLSRADSLVCSESTRASLGSGSRRPRGPSAANPAKWVSPTITIRKVSLRAKFSVWIHTAWRSITSGVFVGDFSQHHHSCEATAPASRQSLCPARSAHSSGVRPLEF